MKVHWRRIQSQKNTYAVLVAACEQAGFDMDLVSSPADDVTCYSLNSIQAPTLIPEIRDAACTTVVGGPHATACWRELVGIADFVVVGEGEWSLPALLRHIESGSPGCPPGVASAAGYCPADCQVVLDAYPPFTHVRGYLEITRGCPHRCGYCQTPGIFGHSVRHRSIDTLAACAKALGQVRFVTPNAFAYGSDGLHPRLEKIERLLRSFGDREVFFGTFPGEVRPDWVGDRVLELVSTYCTNRKIHLGAQSGCDAVLNRINRGHSVDEVYRAVECCRDHGFTPVVDVILGLPGETADEQRETLTLVRWVTREGFIHAHRFIALPGTPLSGSMAADLIPDAEKLLGSLALKGKVTGGWAVPALRFKTLPANRYEL